MRRPEGYIIWQDHRDILVKGRQSVKNSVLVLFCMPGMTTKEMVTVPGLLRITVMISDDNYQT